MNEENLHTVLFDKFLNNSLSEVELADFKTKLINDNDFKSEFMLHTAAVNAIYKVANNSILTEIDKIHTKTIEKPGIFKKWANWLLYGLGLVIAITASYMVGTKNAEIKNTINEKIVTDTIVKVEIVEIHDTVVVEKIVEKKIFTKPKEKKNKETIIKIVNAELQFMYKFFDGQLILYGDYDKSKANFVQKDGQDYLVYSKKVFKLEPTRETRPLIEIADPGLLKIDISNKSPLENNFKGNIASESNILNSDKKIRIIVQEKENITNAYMYDGVYLVLYGDYKNSEKIVYKNDDGSYFLTLDYKDYYEILAKPGIIQKLKPLKKKALEKAKYKLEEEVH